MILWSWNCLAIAGIAPNYRWCETPSARTSSPLEGVHTAQFADQHVTEDEPYVLGTLASFGIAPVR